MDTNRWLLGGIYLIPTSLLATYIYSTKVCEKYSLGSGNDFVRVKVLDDSPPETWLPVRGGCFCLPILS